MDIVTPMSSKYSSHSEINTEQRFSDSLRFKGKAGIDCFLISRFIISICILILYWPITNSVVQRRRDQGPGSERRQTMSPARPECAWAAGQPDVTGQYLAVKWSVTKHGVVSRKYSRWSKLRPSLDHLAIVCLLLAWPAWLEEPLLTNKASPIRSWPS